jgi:hypothetical protein
MSMLATFVQVEPSLVGRIHGDPQLAEQLFFPEPDGFGLDAEAMRAAILERGPQLLAGVIDMHPELRELIEERIGATQEELRRGAGGEALYELMDERLGPHPGGDRLDTRRTLSLDKAWHGVHYLLTGSGEPVEAMSGHAVLGGTEIGEDFSGYGPARLFAADQVAALAEALADPAVEREAVERFDPPRMTELQIYPFGWEEDHREWLLSSLRALARFYAEAAEQGRAVATCLE